MTSQLFNYIYLEHKKVCVSSFFEAVAGAGGVTSDTGAIPTAGVRPLSWHSEHWGDFC